MRGNRAAAAAAAAAAARGDAVPRPVGVARCFLFIRPTRAQVDVVLPAEMELREAHDVGDQLQRKLEALPEVGRAYVHLDIDATHPREH